MTGNYTFFWKNRSPFSQWYPSKFVDTYGMEFCRAEQYMMYSKAMLFKDEATAKKIMATTDPKEQKDLGRQVANFKPVIWDHYCCDVVRAGNWFKFTQNEKCREALMATGDSLLVEASPYDKIWGIGFDEEHALDNINYWGKNYLGECLTQIRDWIREHPAEVFPNLRPIEKETI